MLLILQLKRATAAAYLQFSAFFAFIFNIFSLTKLLSQGIPPDFLPWLGEDVSETFKVALTRIHIAIWAYTGVDNGSCTTLHAQTELEGVKVAVLGWCVPEEL